MSTAENITTVRDLLSSGRPPGEKQPTYTDKQVDIIRTALRQPDVDIEDIAGEVEASETYVRNILNRVTMSELADADDFSDLMPTFEPFGAEEEESEETRSAVDSRLNETSTVSITVEVAANDSDDAQSVVQAIRELLPS